MSSPRTLQARARLQASRQALQRQLHPAGPASPSLAGLIGSHPWALVGAGIAAGAVLGAVLLMRRAPHEQNSAEHGARGDAGSDQGPGMRADQAGQTGTGRSGGMQLTLQRLTRGLQPCARLQRARTAHGAAEAPRTAGRLLALG